MPNENGSLNQSDHTLLARIDERTQTLDRKIDALEKRFNGYVLIARFKPVELLVFGLVAIVLTAVIGALVTLVLK